MSLFEDIGYDPSEFGARGHDSGARYRFVVWGIKGGKTHWGARDFLETCASRKIKLAWVVAPTLQQLETCEDEMRDIFDAMEAAGKPLLKRERKRGREYYLTNGTKIQCRSAERHKWLRGPNVNLAWIDEAAYIRDDAWHQVKMRLRATRGEIICTTTPNGRNWLWTECQMAGLPANDDYGEFGDRQGLRWVSHWPTWEFPWVPADDLADDKRTMPRDVYDRDYGAKFVSAAQSVFRYVEEAMHTRHLVRNPDRKYVLGVDLAKAQERGR